MTSVASISPAPSKSVTSPRIYLYLKSFPPLADGFKGGMSKAVHGLARGLASVGANVTVLCENSTEGVVQTPFGYTVRCFKYRKKGPSRQLSQGLHKFAPEMRGGLAVLNAVFHPSVSGMSKLLQDRGVPYIVAPHDPYHPSIFAKNTLLKWTYWYLRERPMLRRAAAVQVLDARHGELVRKLGVDVPILAAPNGYDEAEVPDEASLVFRTTGTARFAFLGRFDMQNKGLDVLVDAFNALDQSLDVTLTLQGPDGGDQRVIEARSRKNGGTKIDFRAPDFSRSASEVLGEYDVLCLTSRFEGFSMAALEAILAARVVLVSDVAGISPFVKAWGCGEVVTPDVASVKQGLQKLLARREEWKVMGLNGRSNAVEQLGWSSIAGQLLKDYRRYLC